MKGRILDATFKKHIQLILSVESNKAWWCDFLMKNKNLYTILGSANGKKWWFYITNRSYFFFQNWIDKSSTLISFWLHVLWNGDGLTFWEKLKKSNRGVLGVKATFQDLVLALNTVIVFCIKNLDNVGEKENQTIRLNLKYSTSLLYFKRF